VLHLNLAETALDVARAMAHLHKHNIVHSDLKARNVLLRSDMQDPRGFTAKVADFGLSLTIDPNSTHISNAFQVCRPMCKHFAYICHGGNLRHGLRGLNVLLVPTLLLVPTTTNYRTNWPIVTQQSIVATNCLANRHHLSRQGHQDGRSALAGQPADNE
jgi:serine/threonine protein kinase